MSLNSSDPEKEIDRWVKSKLDGDWEHKYGISISSTDNPGWVATITSHSFPVMTSLKAIEYKYSGEVIVQPNVIRIFALSLENLLKMISETLSLDCEKNHSSKESKKRRK